MGNPDIQGSDAAHVQASHADPTFEMGEKQAAQHVEGISPDQSEANLTYEDDDEEPELHARTYIAIVAMLMLNMVQVFGLQGPPAVVWLGEHPSCVIQANR